MIEEIKFFSSYLIGNKSTIKDAMLLINEVKHKTVFVIDDKNQLQGSVTDGDIRRGMINGYTSLDNIALIMNKVPLTVDGVMSSEHIKKFMTTKDILLLPRVGRLNNILSMYSFLKDPNTDPIKNSMVIMAGGKGTRLYPHTLDKPKALVEVGGKPMLEQLMLRAISFGISNFIISINHLGSQIKEYFQDGSKLGVKISYIEEKQFLGTAGSLASIKTKDLALPLIVINCDVLTKINYKELIKSHLKNKSNGTMVVKKHELTNPYGVVLLEGNKIKGFEEKPIYKNYINAGVYIIDKTIIQLINKGASTDMPVLLEKSIKNGRKINAFHTYEEWFDLGNEADINIADTYINKL